MSRQVAAVVLDHRFGSAVRKAVALVIADHADADEWSTVVGQERIAAEAEVGVRTVQRVMAGFEAEGLITRVRRHRKDGTRTSDRVILVRSAVEALPASLPGSHQGGPVEAVGEDLEISHLPLPVSQAGGTTGLGGGSSERDYPPPSPRLPATQSATTRHSLAAQDPSEKPSVGTIPPTPQVSASMLPAERWARRWCEITGQTPTRSILRSLIPAVQDYISVAGEPTNTLLDRAHTSGIRHPGGWGLVPNRGPDRLPDWLETHLGGGG
ncbi:MAG: hypothetical protein L0Z49_00680 [Actinobacteria bacterium]|nr:hypothetical protein [Actinomycetota bacterium]